jgi:hypothetical protein
VQLVGYLLAETLRAPSDIHGVDKQAIASELTLTNNCSIMKRTRRRHRGQ